ncbi:MAG TPA: type I-U CRISPR-associated protein Csb2 [Candidatus Binatia bacterium]|nr:type I-U CRISPR-associated protein Csb2 [Candidatus Binatia bacterium]
MVALEIRFLAGRFHANGWHSAHNEGVPEWPPSPWRILRALVNAACEEQVPSEQTEALLCKLRMPPRYEVPAASDGHVRHYMPDTDDAGHKRAKVFDAFVAVAGGRDTPEPLRVGWEVDLSEEERSLLARLCRRVAYLGRAESWVDITLLANTYIGSWNCLPNDATESCNATSLLTLADSETLASWASGQPMSKKGRRMVPRSLWDVLTFDSRRFQREGWTEVPGAFLKRYLFDAPPFTRTIVPDAVPLRTEPPTVARYAIRSAVLPSLQEALAIGERMRIGAMSRSKRIRGDASPVFSGHGSSEHRHAMYLPCSDGSRGKIDHLMVVARAGFEPPDVLALQQLRRIWGRDGHDLELILVGLGRPAEFGGPAVPRTRVLGESRIWTSLTPFVPTRHPKMVRGEAVDTIPQQIERACSQLIGEVPVSVKPWGESHHWARFRRRRRDGGGRRGPDAGFGVRMQFEMPVRGPIALGYGAHFGLGVFVAEPE